MTKDIPQSPLFEKNGLILLPNQLVIKDTDCRFVALTEAVKTRIGCEKIENIIGLTDRDMTCPSVEFADEFIEQDKKIMALNQAKRFLDYRREKNGDVKISIAEKAPIISNNIVTGLSISIIDVNLSDLTQFGTWFIKLITQQRINRSNINYAFFEIDKQTNSSLELTPRQQEVLFFLLRGKRAIDIAELLHLSKRTVEGHIESLKDKFNCANKTSLIEKAIADGYLNLLPKHFLNKLT